MSDGTYKMCEEFLNYCLSVEEMVFGKMRVFISTDKQSAGIYDDAPSMNNTKRRCRNPDFRSPLCKY